MKIFGKVQGVFFRQHTKQKAEELNIGGWVRNRDDGSVELEAEGEEAPLEKFEAWCTHGPDAASVTRVETTHITAGKYQRFEIRR